MNIQLDVTDENIKQKLAELPDKLLDYAFEVMLKQAQLMRDLAQIYVPVDTGSLRDSIRVERGGEGKHWRQIKVRAGGYVTNPKTGRKVDYAHFQEFGTKYFMGAFYMHQAYDEVKPTLDVMIKTGVVEAINNE